MNRFPSNPVSLLSQLVRCPSITPEADPAGTAPGEAAMADVMEGLLRRLGAGVRRIPLAPGRPNVIGVFEPARRATETVLLAPHLDTVGVAGMTVAPFDLTKRGGRLYGRGTCDTKGPAAALLWAFHRWSGGRSRRSSSTRWVFAATAGEEEGSAGAQAVVKRGLEWKVDFAVALEPTDLKVVHAAKGVLRLWIDVPGRAAHGARPDLGDNAIYRMLPLAAALERNVAPELARRRHAVLGSASLNLGLISGGSGINVVPDRCTVGLDIRVHPGCPAAEALALVKKACRKEAPAAKLRLHTELPSFVTEKDHAWARTLRAEAARGWATAPWFCDANIFGAAGIPSVAFGPGSIAQAHTKDEYIERRELEAGAAAFLRFLEAR